MVISGHFKLIAVIVSLLICWCNNKRINDTNLNTETSSESEFNKKVNSFKQAARVNEIPLPDGYSRITGEIASFENYLQNLPLNTRDNNIYSYDGSVISSGGYHYAIINIDIGTKNLQQCADAVMRLRAEYLFKQKKYKDIHFNFLSDGKPRYYNDYARGDTSYIRFRKYMDYIFSYANSASLKDEMQPVSDINNIKTGDVFIQKGHPIGHAVIVVDMAINKISGKIIMLIAESYMPAQSIHILLNQGNEELSPWYETDFEDPLSLPTWNFFKKDLRRFK